MALVFGVALVGLGIADDRAVAVVDQTVDANWRGAYDVLVTAPDEDFGGSQTAGLVDANFVSTAGRGGISVQQLTSVRHLDGVEIAAPIGFVGTLRDIALSPSLVLMDDPATGYSDVAADGEVLRLTSTLTRSTELGETLMSKSAGVVQLSKRTVEQASQPAIQPSDGYPTGFAPQFNNLFYQIPLGRLPGFPAGVVAVDPEAESRLMGNKGGFLQPLRGAPQERGPSSAQQWSTLVDRDKYLVQETALERSGDGATPTRGVVPLVVNTSADASMTLRVAIERLNGPTSSHLTPAQLKGLAKTGRFDPVTTLSQDASQLGVPFSSPKLAVMPDRSKLPVGEDTGAFYTPATVLEPELVGRPSYTASKSATGSGVPGYKVKPKGPVMADGTAPDTGLMDATGQDPTTGLAQSYRTITKTPGHGAPILPAPIGEFSTNDLKPLDLDHASYVPSGVYSGSNAEVLTGPATGKTVEPNLSALDFLGVSPGAYTDLAGGATLRGDAPIDAIRVRIAGVQGFNAEGRAKVESVAAAIAASGLKATIVAGSSPQPVAVFVPKYMVAHDGAGSDLGWVSQEWTTLGAAVTVTAAMSGMRAALVVTSLLVAAAGYVTSTIISGRRRRPVTRLLSEIGWTGGQIRRRLLLEGIVTGSLVVIAALACIALSGSPVGLIAGIVAVSISALGLLTFVVVAGSVPRTARGKQVRRTVSTFGGVGLRHVLANPASSALQSFGIAAVGVAAGMVTVVLLDARSRSGNTRLAALVFDTSLLAALTVATAGMVAALILVAVGRRTEVGRREEELTVLTEIGVPMRRIRRTHLIETVTIALVGLAISGVILALVSITLNVGAIPAAVALVAVLLALIGMTIGIRGRGTLTNDR